MANIGDIYSFNINGNELTIKDAALTEVVETIVEAIGENNGAIGTRINDLNGRSFDALIKISSNNDSELANIQDGIYKIQYVTITGEGDNEVETLNNSAILVQKGNNQYLYKDDEIHTRIKIEGKWYDSEKDYHSKQYLTIVSLENNNTIGWKASNASLLKTISISTDGGTTWTEYTSSKSGTTLATLNSGDKLLIKGSNTAYGNNDYDNFFTSTGNFNVEGNIMSLLYGDNFTGQTNLTGKNYAFRSLFYNTKLIDASNLILPATTLAEGCYGYMLDHCTLLTTAPELPATTLANNCYQEIFSSCTSLTTVPQLPASSLQDYCYAGMFQGCTSLITAPELPATTLAERCYYFMFSGCTALTSAPELPATTLVQSCYQYMFKDCTSLTTAPELPATTLADYCYGDMFYKCTSLVTAPALPAIALAKGCYSNMFHGCTSLTTAPELPATTLTNYCYSGMFTGCASLNYIKCLASNISATNCTSEWTSNVAASGTFITANNPIAWTTGDNGIPANWNVYTEDEYKEIKKYELNSLINYPVTSVNGATGVVLLSKSDIGLGNVDNTSDANKPVSTATQTALNDKANNTLSNSYQSPTKVQELVSPVSGDTLEAAIQKLNNGIVDDEALWATVLIDLESRITTLQNNVSLPSGYSASLGTNNELIPESGDSLITAISKLHKAVLDLESMYSSLYNDLNTRLTTLET